MKYNINIREEIFGATVSFVMTGKRLYVSKEELNKILVKKVLPSDMKKYITDDHYNIKFVPLNDKKLKKQFSFADIVYLELTRKCNLKCIHCLNNSGKLMNNQLDIEELKKLILDLSEAGVQEIRFTGGEPIEFEGLCELIKLSTDNGIYTSIGTNGTLITQKMAYKLKKAGLKKAVVSIDGTEEKHNIIRGNGNYEKAINGLNNLINIGIDVRVNSVIMKSNMDDVVKLAKELNKNKIKLFIRRFIESGRGEKLTENMLTKQDYSFVKEQLKEELKEGLYVNGHYLRNDEGINSRIKLPFVIRGCKAGQRALAIMPDGEIQLCGFLSA